MNERILGPGEFGRLLHEFLQKSVALAPDEEPVLVRRLREHLGVEDLEAQDVVSREFPRRDRPNWQLALDHLLAEPGWESEVVGLRAGHGPFASLGLIDLMQTTKRGWSPVGPPAPGPITYDNVPLQPGRVLACLVNALLLLRLDGRPLAVLVTYREREMGGGALRLEAVAPERADADSFLAAIARGMREHDVYRGQVLAFARDEDGDVHIEFRALPAVERSDIVLAPGVLERVERHALAPARHRERLLAAGRHLKRGILLHGPPGTGKTLTAMYLASRMPGRTVVILSGQAYGLVGPACSIARDLAPAMVVLEDVDLVAHERVYDHFSGPLLFDLLNEMDGLAPDADVLFMLTTNRPDILEPAIVARPGRIDQAIELALPDADGLRKLIALYGAGLELAVEDLDHVVERLHGASPAHVKELLRKAALLAAEAEPDARAIVVRDEHMESALDDLVIGAGEAKATLFGERAPDAGFPFPDDDEDR